MKIEAIKRYHLICVLQLISILLTVSYHRIYEKETRNI
jgi:hypothetical protein